MAVDVGQLYLWTYDVTDATGAPANATTITLTITLPDQSILTPAVTNPPTQTGHYVYGYPTTQAGLHKFAATTGTPTTAKVDWVDVRQFVSLISIGDAKKHLNEQGTLQDEEIRSFCETATEVVESIVGPCVIRTFTDQVDANGRDLLLPRLPVVAVTSITSVWTGSPAFVTADLQLNQAAGIVRLKSRSGYWNGPFTVVYTAGRSYVPARYVQAAKEMLWHLWTTQRGALADTALPSMSDAAAFETVGGSTGGTQLPPHVMELLQADSVPGFA